MARGEGRNVGQAEPNADLSPPLMRTVSRLMRLIGGLRGPGARARLVAAFVLTLLGKVLAVFSPLVLADGINRLSAGDAAGALPAFLGLAGFWAALRFASTAGPQIRDAIFQPISEEAQRRAGARVFAHVHALSVRFHQSKRTGSVYRTIERGVRAIDFLLRFLAFNIAPTIIELLLAAGVLGFRYGWSFSLIAALTVVIYAWITFGVTEWRLKHRRQMNEADTEAAGRAVDSLLNFETVKSFAAEARESERYDRALASYAEAAIRSNTSLVLLNVLQNLVMNAGLLGMVLAAGFLVARGGMGPGDITAVILIMMNLYAPLNILGFAYREIKQTSIDMEKMFTLLDETPDVADKPGAALLRPSGGEVAFEHVSFAHEGRDRGLDDVSFAAPAGKTTAIVGPSGAGKSTVLKLLFRFYDPRRGPRSDRRPGPARRNAGLAARRARPRAAGRRPLQRHHPLQHRLRPPRRHADRTRRRRAPRPAFALHRKPAQRLGHARRRTRPQALRRREAARRHRPRRVEEPGDPHPRRGHLLA
jgi:ATP-binding cassette, subfamily B, heavy metal transporter